MPRSNRRTEFDNQIKAHLRQDDELIEFWKQYFPHRDASAKFIDICLRKHTTRRMMLRVKWYTDIADSIPQISSSRPALQIIFLVAIAESLARRRFTKAAADKLGSNKLVQKFFDLATERDRVLLARGFRRTMLSIPHRTLRFSSIIRMIYQIRNNAVHGEEYWGFSLVDPEHRENGYTLMTSAYLGKQRRRRRVSVDINLTYEELRDIFVRTAIGNISSQFNAVSLKQFVDSCN